MTYGALIHLLSKTVKNLNFINVDREKDLEEDQK